MRHTQDAAGAALPPWRATPGGLVPHAHSSGCITELEGLWAGSQDMPGTEGPSIFWKWMD